jgi:Fe-S cluster biogenesis protein NfuA
LQVVPEPEPVLQAAPEPEPVLQAAPEPEPVLQAAPEPEPVLQAEPEPEPVLQAEPEPEPVLQAESQAEPEPEVVAAESTSEPATTASIGPDEFDEWDDTVGMPLTMENVQEILDDMVRPALQGDGGDISLIKIEDNDVYVKLVGACNTCPSSTATMKMGVEALFREEFPDMRDLIQVA